MLRFITKHRFSGFDLVWISVSALAYRDGFIVAGILIAFAGSALSVVLENMAKR